MQMRTKENMSFGAAGFVTFAINSIFINFSVSFFEKAGYSETQIGFMLAVTVLVAMAAQVATGYLSDNVLSIKKILLIDIVLTMVSVLLMRPAVHSYPVLFLLYTVFSLSGRMVTQLIDGYITRVAQRRSGLDFGFTRGISSCGYATAAVIGGMLINQFDMDMMFWMHTVLCVIALAVIWPLEDVPLIKRSDDDAGKAKGDSFFVAAKAVFATPGFLLTTIACLLMQSGIYVVLTYYPLIVEKVGGTPGDVGIGMFLLAISEVPVLWNYHRLKRRFQNGHMMIFAMLMYVLKSALWIMFQNVAGVVVIQVMQSVTYALFLPAAMRFMQEILPERHITTGLMIWLAIYSSGGQIVGSLAGGFLMENNDSVTPLYIACAAPCLVGAVLMMFALKRVKTQEPEAA